MKVLVGAAVALSLIAASASAQTGTTTTSPAVVPASTCGALPEAPTLPDGAEADRGDMAAANTAYQAWAQSTQTILTCRQAEALALQAQTDARVTEYNTGAASLSTLSTNWQAEVAEFNARGGSRR